MLGEAANAAGGAGPENAPRAQKFVQGGSRMGRMGILMAAGWKNPTRDLGFCPGFGFWLQKTCLESPRCKGGIFFVYVTFFFLERVAPPGFKYL